MEGSRKRKAPDATPSSSDGSASKKLRLLNSSAPAKSNVQSVGERIVEQLHNATDKTGRPIATQFISLPDHDDLPEYYDIIKLPVSLDTIEEKLQRNAYPTVTTVESDLKRLIQNAKDFNDPKSEIFEDAERVRKLVFNFMKVNNPEYKENPKYSSFPTPIPVAKIAIQNGVAKASAESGRQRRESSVKIKIPPSARTSEQPDKRTSVAPSVATGEEGDEDGEEEEEAVVDDIDFSGKTFQEAHQMIIAYLLRYRDEEGLEIYTPFYNLPSRKLEDYYKFIRHPVCLKSVAKRARGQHGRLPPTGISDFKSWHAFEEEVSFIWRNAQDYNEDGSDMFQLAAEFKEHFQSLIADAKEKVEEPASTKIKLGGSKPKVMLNLSQNRASPAPGVTVDNDALLRQRQMVQAGVNGRQTSHGPTTNGTSNAATSDPTRPSSSAASNSPMRSAIKLEQTATHSPAPQLSQPPSLQPPQPSGTMLPPTARLPTFSTHPQASTPFSHPITLPTHTLPPPLRPYALQSALLPLLTIQPHPHLKLTNPFLFRLEPHPTLANQSATLAVPANCYFVRIEATVGKELAAGRAYRVFCGVNGGRLTQRESRVEAAPAEDAREGDERAEDEGDGEDEVGGRRTHVYEGSLAQGVNRVEVEVAAAAATGEGVVVEKMGVYVFLGK